MTPSDPPERITISYERGRTVKCLSDCDSFEPTTYITASHLDEARAERDEALRLMRQMVREFDKEEREDGFPFNFALRDAFREIKSYLKAHEGRGG